MIKAVIFDVDGVLIESAEIKTQAFALLFTDYPDKVGEIIDYHNKNAGLSRYVKFRYFYEKILGQQLSPAEETELGKEYSRLVLEQVLKAPLVPGTMEFLNQNKDRYRFFIASGTPENELKDIIACRGLSHFFQEVCGSPKQKEEIIEDILARYSFEKKETVFVGDAESDRSCAEQVGVFFVARICPGNHQLEKCRWKINDLSGLETVLNNMSSRLN